MFISRTRAVMAAAAIVAASLAGAAPAGADPADDPCDGPITVRMLCKLMPIAPDLDHDIDLTQGPGTLYGQPLPQMPEGAAPSDDEAPAKVCLNGCT